MIRRTDPMIYRACGSVSLAIPGASSRRTDQQLLRFPNLLPEIFIIRRFRSHERGVWVYPDASATSIKDQKNPSI